MSRKGKWTDPQVSLEFGGQRAFAFDVGCKKDDVACLGRKVCAFTYGTPEKKSSQTQSRYGFYDSFSIFEPLSSETNSDHYYSRPQ